MNRSILLLILVLGCASVPAPPAPGTSQAWGDVRLVPREGVKVGGAGGAYGDRRQRDVEFVDYSRPGFAVVYVAGADPPAGQLDVAILESRIGTELRPALAAVGAAGRLSVHNGTGAPHVLSYPAAGWVRTLAPDQRIEIEVPRSGEQGLYLLDTPTATATVFAAPGPFSVVSASGRFTLTDLEPGSAEIHAWHPRFPPARRRVELAPDAQVRVDLEIGVGHAEGRAASHAHP